MKENEIYKIHGGCKIATYVTKKYKEEICEGSKIWELVKWVGNTFPSQFNKKKFRMIHGVICKLYEYKPDGQTRYFAQILHSYGLVIYDRRIKQTTSLKTAEYNEICKRFKSISQGE